MSKDRGWMYNYKKSSNTRGANIDEFLNGLQEFLTFALSKHEYMDGENIRCPCAKCGNTRYVMPNVCERHVINHGFIPNYHTWVAHGEELVNERVFLNRMGRHNRTRRSWRGELGADNSNTYENMIYDLASTYHANFPNEPPMYDSTDELYPPSDKFWTALNAANQPIWMGHPTESQLSTTVKMLNIKSDNNWSERGINEIVKYIKRLLPKDNVLPESFYHMKKLVEDLGMPVSRIDVCKKGCMLFWMDDIELESCKFCNLPRFKGEGRKQKPFKQLFYFPLAPRLQRMFASHATASHMTWHAHHKTKDNVMCHPSDGIEWKTINEAYPDFSREPRNVRLGLCSDGFAPFGQYGRPYSCWPVILTPYNLPPGMCMKAPYMFISLIIPGPKSPGKNIDIYLQPLVAELKMLWSEGVRTFDVCRGQPFNLRAMLLWTINDFPAYGMLSGWSTHGIHGCPICMKSSNSFRLKFGKKPCYFDSHRQLLAQDHPYRVDTDHFLHGKIVINQIPSRPTGVELWNDVSGLKFAFEDPDGYPPGYGVSHKWTKKSIFWELPYWGRLLIRHNIDFMHVEKNVFENIINTVMNVKGRTKDNINARKEIFFLCNRPELHIDPQSGMNRMSKAVYTLTREDNQILFEWLKCLKFPDGYASNLSRCVDRSGCKLIGLKSHDCHVFLERLLPIAFKNLLPNFVWATLTDLSNFMHDLSSTTLLKTSMDDLELTAPVILCNLATIFPPAFFDSMEHLLVHLPYEAKVGGPVQYRWMYPFERFLHTIKQKIKNKSRIEASICNAYILQEITTFASHYFEPDIQCKQRMPQINTEGPVNIKQPPTSIFNYLGRSSGAKSKRYLDSEELLVAHTYVLLNGPEVEPYYRTFCLLKEGLQAALIDREFATWFRCQIVEENEHIITKDSSELLYYVSYGPLTPATSIPIYFVNGYVWRPKDYGSNRSTMNSGVCVKANDAEYYGLLEEIIELQYPRPYMGVVLFKCVWFDPIRGTRMNENYRLVEVNMKRKYLRYDPFILAQQAIQVYYCSYPSRTSKQSSWMSVCKTKARGKVEEQWTDDNVVYQQEVPITSIHIDLPLNIRSYDVSDLRDHNNFIYMDVERENEEDDIGSEEVDNESEISLHSGGSTDSNDLERVEVEANEFIY